jgi:hypothetical protein
MGKQVQEACGVGIYADSRLGQLHMFEMALEEHRESSYFFQLWEALQRWEGGRTELASGFCVLRRLCASRWDGEVGCERGLIAERGGRRARDARRVLWSA